MIHRHGTELDADFSYCSGNEEPHMGFGHLGFIVEDMPELVKRVEEAGKCDVYFLILSLTSLDPPHRLQRRQASRRLHGRDDWLADGDSLTHQSLPRALPQHGNDPGAVVTPGSRFLRLLTLTSSSVPLAPFGARRILTATGVSWCRR